MDDIIYHTQRLWMTLAFDAQDGLSSCEIHRLRREPLWVSDSALNCNIPHSAHRYHDRPSSTNFGFGWLRPMLPKFEDDVGKAR